MATDFIIAATGCPTGVAHTFMAEAAIIKAAEARGLEVKVETHGQIGVENELTSEEIARAAGVIVAADKDVHAERFAGKPVVDVSVKSGIHHADDLIDQVLAKAAATGAPDDGGDAALAAASGGDSGTPPEDEFLSAPPEDPGATGWRKHGRGVYKHLMNGVSHMLPFVVGGGVLIAASFMWGIYSADPENAQYNSIAATLNEVGGIALPLMVPVLSAFIAESIAKRPGLTVGFITGTIASVNGTGFLGGLLTGFLSGYGMLLVGQLFKRLPPALNGLKAIFLFPVVGTLLFGSVTLVLSQPLADFSTALGDFLAGFQDSNPVLLGLIIGCMCAFDMGGPVNKAAYVTGVALLADGNIEFMAGVSAACITPPLVTALATTFFRRGFEPSERRAGAVNYVLGATHITEGAIPFAARNPLVLIPILIVASSISAILSFLWGAGSPAPHGGFLVLPVVSNAPQWVLAILIGSAVGAVAYGIYRTRTAPKPAATDAPAAVPTTV